MQPELGSISVSDSKQNKKVLDLDKIKYTITRLRLFLRSTWHGTALSTKIVYRLQVEAENTSLCRASNIWVAILSKNEKKKEKGYS